MLHSGFARGRVCCSGASAADDVYDVRVQHGDVDYGATVLPASFPGRCPPLLAIPPVGVGITRDFYRPLSREWARLDAPAALHMPDLIGCGDSTPKRRILYSPEIWAEQLHAYAKGIGQPAVLVVQGGLLPVALEMWRLGGTSTIAGICLLSPPPLSFISDDPSPASSRASPRAPSRASSRARRPLARKRLRQRLLWLAAQSSAGGAFFRYLRGGGERLPRVRSFSEANLFYDPGSVDDEWIDMCFRGSRDTRSRHATFAYLVGTAPGGVWRDERAHLLSSLTVPTQVIRGSGETPVLCPPSAPHPRAEGQALRACHVGGNVM
jgi:pimeloyl-ACP methyl ester carboxylesterase